MLHQAAYQNKPVVVRKLLKLANRRIDDMASFQGKDIIRQWVNCQTRKEEFSALHFASFNGNIEIC